jgi:hypothetical protein
MTCWGQAERLCLNVLVRVKASLNLPVADNHHCQHQTEERCTYSNHARKTYRLEHGVAESGDFVRLDDLHYDWRAWRLHRSIVQHAFKGAYAGRRR